MTLKFRISTTWRPRVIPRLQLVRNSKNLDTNLRANIFVTENLVYKTNFAQSIPLIMSKEHRNSIHRRNNQGAIIFQNSIDHRTKIAGQQKPSSSSPLRTRIFSQCSGATKYFLSFPSLFQASTFFPSHQWYRLEIKLHQHPFPQSTSPFVPLAENL